jgi:hypothetical protein
MTRTPVLLALGAAAALAGCNKQDHTIVAGPNIADDGAVNSTSPVALPPSVTASKIYRCADNTIVYVDWLSDGKSANVRTEQGGVPTQVTSAEAGQPMTAAGGFEVSGTAAAPSAKIAIPGHAAQNCKA